MWSQSALLVVPLGLLLLVGAVSARHLQLEVAPTGLLAVRQVQTRSQPTSLSEPRIDLGSWDELAAYQGSEERPRYYIDTLRRPAKRYLGVEIPDEIARTRERSSRTYIDRIRQQMASSGK